MAFDPTVISGARAIRRGPELLVRWASTAPAGTSYQLYVGRRLAWTGTTTHALIPEPSERTSIVVGAVDDDESETDLSATIDFPETVQDRVRLAWTGGTVQAGVADFAIYGEDEPGGGIDDATPIAVVPASSIDAAEASYSWTSTPTGSGTWHFRITPRNAAGVEGTGDDVDATLAVPPRPPEAAPDGSRLAVDGYDDGTRIATLTWQASPAHPPPAGTGEVD